MDPVEHKTATYNSINVFIKKIVEIPKTPLCGELLGIDIRNPKIRKKANDEGLFDNLCPEFIASALEIISEMFPE